MDMKRITRNHEEIKHWAEERDGVPAVPKTNDVSSKTPQGLYIDFLDNGENKEMKQISWNEFFEKFEEKDLAFVYKDKVELGAENKEYSFVKLSDSSHTKH
jgi:hypothetical protein